jgi:hypothetical protein
MTTTEPTTTDRQPCACGARPLLTWLQYVPQFSAAGYAMSCTACGAWGPAALTVEGAWALWNMGERGPGLEEEDDGELPWETALSAAIDLSGRDYWVIAIWSVDGSIEALIYQGQVFM